MLYFLNLACLELMPIYKKEEESLSNIIQKSLKTVNTSLLLQLWSKVKILSSYCGAQLSGSLDVS